MSSSWLTPAIGIGLSTSLSTSSEQNQQNTQVDDLFSSTAPTQDMIDNIAAAALSSATKAQQSGNTQEAITDYKLSIGLSPYSANSVQAYQLLSQIYQKQGNNGEAINLLKQAQEVFPQCDTIDCALGDIYYGQKDYTDAVKTYSKAVAENPGTSSDNYSLGQAYMAEGNYTAAETQFETATQLTPNDTAGYYALGQVYHKMGDYSDAVVQLNKALTISPKDSNSLLELGETYVDMNNLNAAKQQLGILTAVAANSATANQSLTTSNTSSTSNNSSTTAESAETLLQAYITQHTDPKIVSVYSSGFNATLGPDTQLSTMDSAYSQPNTTKIESMNFVFSNDMNTSSVQNVMNWQISRSNSSDPGGAYNFGMPISSTEVSISPIPLSVSYNSDTKTATVQFSITQNASGNGTIDPEHIMFKFFGKDAYGNNMDSMANEYSGISQIA
ncbi:MAG: tetratricopeptide repeat protein [Dissulfurispiraceae bacterium]